MGFIMEQLSDQPVAYMRRIGAYGVENFKLMEAMKAWADRKGLLQDGTIYAIAYDGMDTPPEKCRYDVCLALSADFSADEAVQRGEIPGGKFAVFTVPHTTEAVQAFWGSVFQLIENHHLSLDSTKPILERYQHKIVENGKCEFCVPIL